MDKDQTIEHALVGLLVGGARGYGLSYLFVLITNMLNEWLNREPIQFTWKSWLTLAILMGLALAINMAHPPFGD
jgi:hypothetical protein